MNHHRLGIYFISPKLYVMDDFGNAVPVTQWQQLNHFLKS